MKTKKLWDLQQILFVCLCALAFVGINSCSGDEAPRPVPQPIPRFYGITDGANLANINLSYQQSSRAGDYFKDFHLFINLKYDPLHPSLNAVEELEDEYLAERYSFIEEKVTWFGNAPRYFAAYVNGDVTITCDKTLFGKEPGEPLNEYFTLDKQASPFTCQVAGVDEPRFLHGFGEEQPDAMSDIFTKEAWLFTRPVYAFTLKEQPTEKYSRVTFYMTFPVKKEHTWEYAKAIYDGEKPVKIFSEEVFTAECTINFKWSN